MPDGDKVHAGLPARYQQPYKMLCEQFDVEENAWELAHRIKRDVSTYGDSPRLLITQAAVLMQQAQDAPLFLSQEEWAVLGFAVEDLGARTRIPDKRARGLALRACKEFLHALRSGYDSDDIAQDLMTRYLVCIYDAQFHDSAPLIDQHHAGMDQATFQQALMDVRPYVERELRHFAGQIVRSKSVARLSIRRRSPERLRRPGNDENLLDLWSKA